MKKKDILEHLINAKAGHIRWVQRARLLIKGVSLDKDAIPIDATQCKFGKWLYKDGQLLSSIPSNTKNDLKRIENLHLELHDIYLRIFSIYFEDNRNFLLKLFSPRKKISQHEQLIAEEYYEKIKETSEKLIGEIEKLERKIIAIPESEIEKLF